MGFMQKQTHYGTWAVCDTRQGTYFISDEIYGRLPEGLGIYVDESWEDDGYLDACWTRLRDFLPITEREDLLSVEEETGYAARLSAPGYLDCTDWQGVYRTEEEALLELSEVYDD